MPDLKHGQGLEISLGLACNYRCEFCFDDLIRERKGGRHDDRSILGFLRKGRDEGRTFVIFSGGEPTMDPRLPGFVRAARAMGYEHARVMTNGALCTDADALRPLRDAGLTGAMVSLHGLGPVCDAITRHPGSFRKIVTTLVALSAERLRDPTFSLDTNTVVCRKNVGTLPQLMRFLARFPAQRRQLAFPFMMFEFPDAALREVFPDYELAAASVTEALDVADRLGLQDVTVETMPYCLLPDRAWRHIDVNWKTDKDMYFGLREFVTGKAAYAVGKTRTPACDGCFMADRCAGFSADYLKVFPEPRRSTVSEERYREAVRRR